MINIQEEDMNMDDVKWMKEAIKQAKKLLQREGLLPPDEPLAS